MSGTPVEIRRAALHSMQRLLPKMPLAGYAAAILHPLMRVLDGAIDELRADAADTICAVALALGPDFTLFVPSIRRVWPVSITAWKPLACEPFVATLVVMQQRTRAPASGKPSHQGSIACRQPCNVAFVPQNSICPAKMRLLCCGHSGQS